MTVHTERAPWLTLGMLGLLLAALVGGGCTGGSGSRCRTTCEARCQAFAGCGLGAADPATCADDCIALSTPSECANARPPDQLTCDELKEVHDCSQYCTTVCRRGPSCGTFSESFCDTGCASAGPPVCNPASVDARTCDQLKPELRQYEDRGRALAQPGTFVGGGPSDPKAFGLCRDGSDCAAPLGCAVATNTCAPCTANADCAHPFDEYLCSASATCVKVDCLTSADCFSFAPACDPTTFTCVQCLGNEDCVTATPSTYRRCNLTKKSCVECLTNADCTSDRPTCDPSLFICLF